MIYDINKFYDMFSNLDKEIIDIVCEQNINPTLIFDKLLEISNANDHSLSDTSQADLPTSYIIDQPIEIENYMISTNDNVIPINNTNNSQDTEEQTKCPCINLSSFYNVDIDKNQNIKYTKLNTKDSDDEDEDELFKL